MSQRQNCRLTQPTLSMFSKHVKEQASRHRELPPWLDDNVLDSDVDLSGERSTGRPGEPNSTSHAIEVAKYEKTPEEIEIEVQKKFSRWILRKECIFVDDASVFVKQDGGIICRICNAHSNHLPKTRDEYVKTQSRPYREKSLTNHVKTETHLRAVQLWLQDKELREKTLTTGNPQGHSKHNKNQFRAVNQICHRHNSINDFKSLTNVLNSVDNEEYISIEDDSDYARFWKLAGIIDRTYTADLYQLISPMTPLSLSLDISTDVSTISVLCVNLRFLTESHIPRVILVGLAEMDEGTSGKQIYLKFRRIMEDQKISMKQVVSVATDGDPAMTGTNHGFLGELEKDNKNILHHKCDAHNLQLALKYSFQVPDDTITATLIHNAATIINLITKNPGRKRQFANEQRKRKRTIQKLSKPIQVRWSTCAKTIKQSFEYADSISTVLQSAPGSLAESMVECLTDPTNLLRMGALSHLLSWADQTNKELQSDSLTVCESSECIGRLRDRCLNTSKTDVEAHLSSIISSFSYEQCLPFISIVADEFVEWAQILATNLEHRFANRSSLDGHDLFTHDNLMRENTHDTDMALMNFANLFSHLVPTLLQRHLLIHWHCLKSIYQLEFSGIPYSSTGIIDAILSHPRFQTLTAIIPLVRVSSTIMATSVATEREFSLVHYIKRKERSLLTTNHLELLARIAHNAPVLLSNQQLERLMNELNAGNVMKVKRRESTPIPGNPFLTPSSSKVQRSSF